jgi:hypothetical protein
MDNEVEARTQRVRDHLQRPNHPDRPLTNAKVGSTVNRTLPLKPLPQHRSIWYRAGLLAALELGKEGAQAGWGLAVIRSASFFWVTSVVAQDGAIRRLIYKGTSH